jgi:alkylation response protein AidB-like acyl-CoA dehydrogenase
MHYGPRSSRERYHDRGGPIAGNADVKRMLLSMKARTIAARMFCITTTLEATILTGDEMLCCET